MWLYLMAQLQPYNCHNLDKFSFLIIILFSQVSAIIITFEPYQLSQLFQLSQLSQLSQLYQLFMIIHYFVDFISFPSTYAQSQFIQLYLSYSSLLFFQG